MSGEGLTTTSASVEVPEEGYVDGVLLHAEPIREFESADYAEVIWDERYRVPRDVGGDVCDYPLARNLVLLAVTVASEAALRFAATGAKPDWSATLADLAVLPIGQA